MLHLGDVTSKRAFWYPGEMTSLPIGETTPPPPRAWCVYVLRCSDGSLYTGSTNDLAGRVARHNAGRGAAYTRSRLPVTVAYAEPATDRSAALRREAAIKRLGRREKLALVLEAPEPRS